MVYLCGRPIPNRGRCTLGRETAIQPMTWGDDGWLRTTDGDGLPALYVAAPGLPAHPFPRRAGARGLRRPRICRSTFQWLRSPWPEELFSLTARPGHLRLYGRETPGSLFRQALVARRQQAHCFSASTVVDFEPAHFQQMAGLICYYGGAKFHYLYVSHDDALGRCLRVMSALPDSPAGRRVHGPASRFRPGRSNCGSRWISSASTSRYRVAGGEWTWLPQMFDASILSDEATSPGLPNFTGAFVGMACQDMAGTALPADFDWFEYRERQYRTDPA